MNIVKWKSEREKNEYCIRQESGYKVKITQITWSYEDVISFLFCFFALATHFCASFILFEYVFMFAFNAKSQLKHYKASKWRSLCVHDAESSHECNVDKKCRYLDVVLFYLFFFSLLFLRLSFSPLRIWYLCMLNRNEQILRVH